MSYVTISVKIEYDKEVKQEDVEEQIQESLQTSLITGYLDITTGRAISVDVITSK